MVYIVLRVIIAPFSHGHVFKVSGFDGKAFQSPACFLVHIGGIVLGYEKLLDVVLPL